VTIDLSQISFFLSIISSSAVIAGAIFIIFQLRQNAKLIEVSARESRMNTSLALLEKLTDESFARRRKRMHDTIRKYRKKNWADFDDSLDDFEARDFAYIYELLGQLTRDETLDIDMVTNALQYLVVIDWEMFSPMAEHFVKRWGVNSWRNFEWLANRVKMRIDKRERRISHSLDTTRV